MNLEQLKLVLETFNAAGEGGRELFLWWLAKGFVTDLIGYACLVIFLIAMYRIGRMTMNNFTLAGRVCDVMGDSYPMYSSTKKRALKILRDHRENK